MSEVTIRAVRPDDKQRIVSAFRALEPHSIYLRFFQHKKGLSDEELRRVTERELALVATVGDGAAETIVGMGNYVRTDSGAEVAFAVEEDYQGRGIATELLRRLVDVARAQRVWRLEADVLAENAPMLAVFRHSGLPLQESQLNSVVHMTLFLD